MNQSSQDAAPAGTGSVRIDAGDCLMSVAAEHGFFWETIWNHAENANLRQARRDPMVLLPGDRLTIPERNLAEIPKSTGAKHRFKIRGRPAKLRLRFQRSGNPLKNTRVIFEIEGVTTETSTNGQGIAEVAIPPGARSGLATVGPPDAATVYSLNLGGLDPSDSIAGAQHRLANLGLYQGDVDGQANPEFTAALQDFQGHQHLPVDGKLTRATAAKLEEVHGS
ncbi:MAG: peptidoglycan-binding protein [Verrucomicrobiales bacterium]|nr:peptidoglycan-binding protein [Verrucomicrobiales bacterium]